MEKRLRKSDPVLASLNMDATVEFYTEILGFRAGWHDENYAILARDDIAIHFWKCDNKIHPENTSCYVYVDGVDDLFEEMKVAGVVHPKGSLKDQPWGMREFAILDNFGNMIKFGQPL